jgi:hypothetical protein
MGIFDKYLVNSFLHTEDSGIPLPTPFYSENFSVSLGDFTTSGDAVWVRVTNDGNGDLFSARSGAITDKQISTLELVKTTTQESTYLQYDYKTSTEGNYDFLLIMVDNVIQKRYSGTNAWTTDGIFLHGIGSKTIKFIYWKDNSSSSGTDQVWVDNVKLYNYSESAVVNTKMYVNGDFNVKGNVVFTGGETHLGETTLRGRLNLIAPSGARHIRFDTNSVGWNMTHWTPAGINTGGISGSITATSSSLNNYADGSLVWSTGSSSGLDYMQLPKTSVQVRFGEFAGADATKILVVNGQSIFRDNITATDFIGNLNGLNSYQYSRNVFKTTGTGASDANKYTKIARVTLTGQYQNTSTAFHYVTNGQGAQDTAAGKVNLRVKQQAAFGNNPIVELVNYYDATQFAEFGYVIVQNTPTTIVDIYVKVTTTYCEVTGYLTAEDYSNSSKIIWYDSQAYSTIPAGYTLDDNRLVISADSNGNVGINYTAPQTGLHMYDTVANATAGGTDKSIIRLTNTYAGTFNSGGEIQFGLHPSTSGTSVLSAIKGTYATFSGGNYGGNLDFYTRKADGLGLINRMRISNSGFIGIGTTNPSYTLDLTGSMRLSTTPTTSAGGFEFITRNTSTGVVEKKLGYKVYTALISQSGTAAPTVTVLENTLGGTVVWTRSSVGTYIGTLSGAFTANKTAGWIQHNLNGSYAFGTDTVWYSVDQDTGSTIKINVTNQSGTATDSSMKQASLEIRVYP